MVSSLCLCLSLFSAGVTAAGGGAAGGAGHWDSRGTDLHIEGGAGQTAGGAGRHQGPTERDQQPVNCTAGLHEQTHLFVLCL